MAQLLVFQVGDRNTQAKWGNHAIIVLVLTHSETLLDLAVILQRIKARLVETATS